MDKNTLRNNIPKQMQQLRQWCMYKTEEVEGHLTKRIINAKNGRWARCNMSEDFVDFEFAMKQAEKYAHQGIQGIAFALTKESGITCIDVDCCRMEDGTYSAVAEELQAIFAETYIERSISGKGLHIFALGNLAIGAGKKNEQNGVEMYDESRFISMTGDIVNSKNMLVQCQEKITIANEKYIGKVRPTYIPTRKVATQTDAELISKIRSSKQGAKFSYLFGGGCEKTKPNGSPDYSSADFSLCCMLAFWTHDEAQIDSIYRSSGLYGIPRENEKGIKWEKRIGSGTYGTRTIQNAMRCISTVKMDKRVRAEPERE